MKLPIHVETINVYSDNMGRVPDPCGIWKAEEELLIPVTSIASTRVVRSLSVLGRLFTRYVLDEHDVIESIHKVFKYQLDIPWCHPNGGKCDSIDQCEYASQLPLYIITVPNVWNAYPQYYNGTIPTLRFIVHPNERDRMERILGGTYGPMHDLVHHLQFSPELPLATQGAKARYEARQREAFPQPPKRVAAKHSQRRVVRKRMRRKKLRKV